MNWETVKIESKTIGRSAAFASVGRGQIVFNTTATKQIPNIENVEFVNILSGTENGSTFVGFLFKERMEEDCLKVKQRRDKQGAIVSVTVSNKAYLERLDPNREQLNIRLLLTKDRIARKYW